MGVTGELQVRPIYTLSGGQKARIAMAMMTYCLCFNVLLPSTQYDAARFMHKARDIPIKVADG